MTRPDAPTWDSTPAQFRRSEITATIGHGDDDFARAAHDVLRWAVKTRSGFAVSSDGPATSGQRLVVTAGLAGVTVREPVQVLDVVRSAERVGFSYRALPGHPVRGEEAFVVHRDGAAVLLTIRSLTRPAPGGPWRWAFPLLLVAQRVARARYVRALRRPDR
ncbi:hypothetical protein TPB0596_40730 [Tsukamurella pulmonis]|uniref:Uncharacterized protein, UPF0548 family n=1 Tax=Tsukamurella pulmonis TaxID=47312 RepID=A0A1H1BTT4_9ACTN|nr:DUF1990 domain-containing protein [Tsukamurella pulmonis]KXO90207.1 hypothetical protein AXK56_08795 [Tsukamurella pulmonis]KXP11460.1 hypothetical protein AXK57_09025 [Tsukamurella pulmonis]RDH10535.1 DUF1990 domain-containing protein [Tsukamurella pulmonis]SDQ55345.1 Uncharacterized protein, UPF0548 family [Tsukamurella pulmonis]SUP24664.1 Uncharacterized protein conserved in bacteria [Tsukamurella pulmonis]